MPDNSFDGSKLHRVKQFASVGAHRSVRYPPHERQRFSIAPLSPHDIIVPLPIPFPWGRRSHRSIPTWVILSNWTNPLLSHTTVDIDQWGWGHWHRLEHDCLPAQSRRCTADSEGQNSRRLSVYINRMGRLSRRCRNWESGSFRSQRQVRNYWRQYSHYHLDPYQQERERLQSIPGGEGEVHRKSRPGYRGNSWVPQRRQNIIRVNLCRGPTATNNPIAGKVFETGDQADTNQHDHVQHLNDFNVVRFSLSCLCAQASEIWYHCWYPWGILHRENRGIQAEAHVSNQ